jgi:hypothetical protein
MDLERELCKPQKKAEGHFGREFMSLEKVLEEWEMLVTGTYNALATQISHVKRRLQ